MIQATQATKLAIDGGAPAVTTPLPPMYPGGMRIGAEEEEAVLRVLRSKRLYRYYGPTDEPSRVAELEDAFAPVVGVKHAAAVSSGCASLICALAGLGVGPGDEVIVPAYTWIATASAVMAVGAVPILAEVDESLTLDPADAERKITRHTKAIIPVHMRGAPSAMDEALAVARRHDLKVLEDVAQADGGSYRGRRLGGIGDVGAFSLQFNKILTCGEGGMVTTNDDAIHARVLMYNDVAGGLRNHIPEAEILPGINFRMSELQGAVALVQLGRLDDLLATMRRNKTRIKEGIAEVARRKGVAFRRLNDPAGDGGVAIIFFLPTPERAAYVVRALEAEGVDASLVYDPEQVDYHVYAHWTPILDKRTWSANGGPWRWHSAEVAYTRDMCPRTLDLTGRAVHLNVSPELTDQNMTEMVEAVNKVLSAAL
ncbi:MAG TPA: DegT/DnrJ/EryC1/StrS family aminotransferase [Thermomicrobiales bacterium]|nr:DegT/DnrJ/EryC1/StrS family aminotransferase [Thermomicrobiales bacterium]